jgi:hypothetical protein
LDRRQATQADADRRSGFEMPSVTCIPDAGARVSMSNTHAWVSKPVAVARSFEVSCSVFTPPRARRTRRSLTHTRVASSSSLRGDDLDTVDTTEQVPGVGGGAPHCPFRPLLALWLLANCSWQLVARLRRRIQHDTHPPVGLVRVGAPARSPLGPRLGGAETARRASRRGGYSRPFGR